MFYCHFVSSQGDPGVPVHLSGQEGGRGPDQPQPALLGVPAGPHRQLPSVLQDGDRPPGVGTLWRGEQFRRAASNGHGAVVQGAGGDRQVRLESFLFPRQKFLCLDLFE